MWETFLTGGTGDPVPSLLVACRVFPRPLYSRPVRQTLYAFLIAWKYL